MKFEKDYFEEVYQDYERQNPKRKLNSYLNQILKHKKSGKLLDIGCARGNFIKNAGGFFEVFGIDISKHAVNEAKRSGLDAKVAKAEKTGFKKDEFDVITMFDVIEHLSDLSILLKEIKRILRPEGLLVLSVPVYDKLAGRIVRDVDKDPTHVHKQSRSFWIRLLKENGFRIISYKGIMRYFLFKDIISIF